MKNKIWKRTMQVLGFVIILGMAVFSYKGNKSQEMGFERNSNPEILSICPDKPNCVSSFEETSDEHYTPPLEAEKFNSDKMIQVITGLGCEIKTQENHYLHFECTSNLFKFVDDIEVLFTPDTSLISFRSASRVGHSDLGVNAKRVNKIKELYLAE